MVFSWLFGSSNEGSDYVDAAQWVKSQQGFAVPIGLPASHGRLKERVLVPVSGIALDRALAEDAIREARRAAALRGEVLANEECFLDDSDMEVDLPVHIQIMDANDMFGQFNESLHRVPSKPDVYEQENEDTESQSVVEEQRTTAPNRPWRYRSPLVAASAVVIGATAAAIGHFISAA
mmetsp:Transcript_6340/g.8919  ORF Transcript_6340/g.8919 Transcript_6340/m.8919 type:complete len:178 (+) Transcript_6340:62-595(+)|eukprot:CAMPEP_0197298404 /NCGR_PEP_ID=MMETSP0890-20130614/43427_1 /TAXON_ID=44058 ORGANISM="Aureoumbra lagunensis, Strain CCMP1510" /NCGR_SAMPLE_ID=MMETSP0890 /ASSEMBLY_ACC=CAM_ASM_000533 /LENGTH=177 /DNA_ID=CAMNT_0042776161 /DNA_START=39 /DNA_END=572 /DNA_ORIENTATION=+